MKSRSFVALSTLLAVCLFSFIAIRAFAQSPGGAKTASTPLTLTNTDLAKAGYTKVTPMQATGTLFQAPTHYYTVDVDSYLTVYIGTVADPSWTYNDGKIQIQSMGKQIQARVSRPGYYIVVTGPDTARVTSLANILQTK